MLITGLLSFQLVSGQKVDGIKTEQSGDFIKIRYKLLDSKPGEVYRVTILCSINGGLKTELESISGDAGDQVPGGRSEYWVIWDVLKDVDELKSADFIVRAELLNAEKSADKTGNTVPNTVNESETEYWAKKRFNILLSFMGPGPKSGLRFSYMGSWGISGQFVTGKTEKGEVSYVPPASPMYGFDITKRAINRNNIQMHMMLGVQRASLLFHDPGITSSPYMMEDVAGPEFGFLFGVSRLTFDFTVTRFDPGQVEKGTDFMAVSPFTYVSFGLGVRF
jgi:hypothetical protein